MRTVAGFLSVPFKTESGVSYINGVAKFSAAGVVLEFESKLFGVISGGIKERSIRMEEILDIRFKKGFLKRFAKIEIRPVSLAAVASIPTSEGKIILRLQRADFERAREAVTEAQRFMSEYAASAPPVRTSVSQLFTSDDVEHFPEKREK